MLIALIVGALSLYWATLNYIDYQWLSEHFGSDTSTRWSPDVIQGYLTTSVLFFAIGGLGVVTFVLGFLKVRKALDDDNQDAIKRWTLMTAVLAVLPGAGLAGLLELFIWRAHSSEKFTIFGLLGKAPEAPLPPPSPIAIAQAHAAEDEVRRKQEYASLFGASAPAPPAPVYQQPDYGGAYAAPQEAYAPPAAAGGEVAPAAAAAVPEATQYTDQPSGAPICTCGRPMEWIAEYGRYYCYTDDRYEGEA
jgi:hypothetical protein